MKLTVSEDKKQRLDVFLCEGSNLSRSRIKTLVDDGRATINGALAQKCGQIVGLGDVVELDIPPDAPLELVSEDIDIDIIYQDDDIAVVNKPIGIAVHPSFGHKSGTLVNALLFRLTSLSSINGVIRPGIVHRLDKQTSGVMVVAKNDFAHGFLAKQFKERQTQKIYLAIVKGHPKAQSGTIITNIGRSKTDRKKMAVVASGRQAVTKYRVLKLLENNTAYVEFEILTGRTHQIRVHAKHIGHPIVGDELYGNAKKGEKQLLHAYKISFIKPSDKKRDTFVAPLPDYFLLRLQQ